MLEKDIQTAILSYLDIKGIFAYNQPTVGVWDKERERFRLPSSKFRIKGIADIIGIYKGRFLAIEVKTPKRRKNLSVDQANFLDRIRREGGIAFVATSIEEVRDQLGSILD